MAVSEYARGFVESIIGVLIAVALLPTIITFISQANVTGATALVISLVPLFIGLGIVLHAIKSFL